MYSTELSHCMFVTFWQLFVSVMDLCLLAWSLFGSHSETVAVAPAIGLRSSSPFTHFWPQPIQNFRVKWCMHVCVAKGIFEEIKRWLPHTQRCPAAIDTPSCKCCSHSLQVHPASAYNYYLIRTRSKNEQCTPYSNTLHSLSHQLRPQRRFLASNA